MSRALLVPRYALFAVLATVANLMLQRLAIRISPTTMGYVLGLCLGTGVGLALKFVLDKFYIFGDRSQGLRRTGRSFLYYAATGIITTLVFAAVETAFWLYWEAMREAGALLGLTIGYVAKYQLDRQFVFTATNDKAAKA